MSFFALFHRPPSQIPATQTVSFGAKTRVGHGGYPLGYQGAGTLSVAAGDPSNHWQIDNRGMLVPKNGAGAYGTVGPTFSGPYTLTITDGAASTSTVTVNMVANAAHMREMYSTPSGVNQDTTSSFQLRTLLGLAQGVAGAMLLGDTIYGRDGIGNAPNVSSLNQGGAVYRVRPPALVSGACWATGSGGYASNARIRITSDTINTSNDTYGNPVQGGYFFCGGLSWDSATSGPAAFPVDMVYVTFYFNVATGGTTLLGYSGSTGNLGWDASAYHCRFELGLAVPASKVDTLTGFAMQTGAMDNCYVKNVGRGVTGGLLDAGTTTITSNIFDGMQSDGMTLNGNNLVVTDNFLLNFQYFTGAHPDAIQHLGFANGLTITNFGSFLRNIAVRNVAVSGHGDAQGIFFDSETPLTRTGGAVVTNNINLLTAANGIALTRFNAPIANYNTNLTDFQASSGGTLTMSITVPTSKGGTDGTFQRNLTTGLSVAPQGGAVTTTFTTVLAKTLPAYTGALPAYTNTSLNTRALVITAMTPSLNGTAKNADGTYSGALFPIDNAGHVGWNDGTVFNPADTHTQAT